MPRRRLRSARPAHPARPVRPTLDSLARKLKLSAAAVSKALAGKPDISEATRAAVRAEALRQGYVANHAAETLRSGRSRIVVAIYDTLAFGQQPVMDAMDEALAAGGYRLLLCSTRGEARLEHSAVQWALSISAEGLILRSALAGREFSEHYSRLKLPTVFLQGPVASRRIPGSGVVRFDEEHSAAEAAAHLAGLGHRRIGLVMNTRYNQAKQAGARRGVGASGGMCELLHTENPGEEAIASACRPQLDLHHAQRCTAFICSGYLISVRLMALARAAGLRAPRDYSIVGFDDTNLAQYTNPTLSAIRLPDREMGVIAAEMWLRLRERHPHSDSKGGGIWTKSLKPEFIVRESCGPAPRLRNSSSRKLEEVHA